MTPAQETAIVAQVQALRDVAALLVAYVCNAEGKFDETIKAMSTTLHKGLVSPPPQMSNMIDGIQGEINSIIEQARKMAGPD